MIKFIDRGGKVVSQGKFPESMNFSALEQFRARKNAGSKTPNVSKDGESARKLATSSTK